MIFKLSIKPQKINHICFRCQSKIDTRNRPKSAALANQQLAQEPAELQAREEDALSEAFTGHHARAAKPAAASSTPQSREEKKSSKRQN